MTDKQYLEALEKELRFLKQDEREEVLGDYAEHFELAKAKGESVERVIGRLGSPKSVAQEYKLERRVEKAVARPSARSVGRAVGAVVLSGVCNALVIAPLYVCGALTLTVLYISAVSVLLSSVAGSAALIVGVDVLRSVQAGFGISNPMMALLLVAVAAAGGEIFIFAKVFGRWFFRSMAALARKLVGGKEKTA